MSISVSLLRESYNRVTYVSEVDDFDRNIVRRAVIGVSDYDTTKTQFCLEKK